MKFKTGTIKKQSGVTLLEIMVAMVILTMGLVFSFEIFPMGFRASYKSRNETTALMLGQNLMERIINNNEVVDCRHEHSATCRFVPPGLGATDLGSTTLGDTTNMDCRYFVGHTLSEGKVRGGSLCHWDSGSLDLVNWTRFDAADSTSPYYNYWFHIEVVPVLDPGANNATSGPTRASLYRDWWNMARVTVRVRGPIDDINKWDDIVNPLEGSENDVNRALPSEVILTTYVSNHAMGLAEIDVTATNTLSTGSVYEIAVKDIRNFTVFNDLDAAESSEPSMVFQVTGGGFTSISPGNSTGIDNVIIERIDKDTNDNGIIDGSLHDPGVEWDFLYQTNKIISIKVDGSTSDPDQNLEIPGNLKLANKLKEAGSQNDTMVEVSGTPGTFHLYQEDIDKGDGTGTMEPRYVYHVYQLVTIPQINTSDNTVDY